MTLSGNGKQDIAINELPGYSQESYGSLRITSEPVACVSGTMGLYTFPPIPSDPGFSFVTPLTEALRGTSYGAYNTFNPSTHSADESIPTIHWLQLANVSTETRKL